MENKRKILSSKIYLYLTEFFAGMSVMAVELLGMRVIDDIIKEEVQYYKGIYKEEGFEGLKKALE